MSHKYYFPLHLDGGNRGCEAIAKGTAILLDEHKENLIGLCTNIPLDQRLGVANYVSLTPAPIMNRLKLVLRKAHRLIAPQRSKHMEFVYKQRFGSFINSLPKDGIVLSTGGDMFCYDNNEAVYTTRECQSKGLKTFLWGCSIGEKDLTKEKLEVLRKFDLIYVRETLSEDVLKKHGLTQIIRYPDPAFILEPEETELPDYIKGRDVIGFNLSSFILSGDGSKLKMIKACFDYIIENTKLDILLVPHVLWGDQDDRFVANNILKEYTLTNRVHVLDSDSYNYCEIRSIISKMRYFVGARTHSVISAYSVCVPAIALGYSIKSRGIAKDIGLPEYLVVDCTQDIYEEKILNSLKKLIDEEKSIKIHLIETIPIYKKQLEGLLASIQQYL